MRVIRFICLMHLLILSSDMLFGVTLTSQVDARRSGGTSTGTFTDNLLPSFLLAPTNGTFGIQNASAHPLGSWEFAVGPLGFMVVQGSATINLSQINSFSSARIGIDASGIGFSSDRFNPSNPGFLFARVGGDYYAFQVAQWSNNNNANPDGDRLRFYGAMPATLLQGPSTIVAIPETSAILISCVGALALTLRRKREV